MTASRTLVLAFAALALSVLLLRPVCNAAHPHMHLSEPESCCQNVGDSADVKPLDLASEGTAKPAAFAPAAAYLYRVAARSTAQSPMRAAAPPPLPYHVRSSRILS